MNSEIKYIQTLIINQTLKLVQVPLKEQESISMFQSNFSLKCILLYIHHGPSRLSDFIPHTLESKFKPKKKKSSVICHYEQIHFIIIGYNFTQFEDNGAQI
jgi:hypothetical protein